MAYELDPGVVDAAFGGEIVVLAANKAKVPSQTVSVGLLSVPSGALIALEPYFPPREPEDLAFTTRAPAGRWPFEVAAVDIGEGSRRDWRNAFARVRWSDAPAVRWRMALRPGQYAFWLGADEIYGHSADGGMSGFMDVEVARRWSPSADFELVDHPGFRAGMNGNGHRPDAVIIRLSPPASDPGGEPDNFAVCGAGFGDGVYASYFGYDAAGDTVAVLTDFAILSD